MKCLIDAGHRYAGHFSYGALLTGTYAKGWKSAGKSLDQVIAEDLRKKGVNRPALQLNLGIAPDGEGTSWRDAGVRNTSETDPARAVPVAVRRPQPVGARPQQAARAQEERARLPDRRAGRVRRRAWGREDRMKIEAHTGSIRDIERQLDSGGGGSATCMSPTAPAGPFNMASRSAAAVRPADRGPALRPDPGGDHGRLRRARQVRRLALVHRRLAATTTRWPTRAARATPRR